ncbi:MAG: hypothetical protein AAGF93_22620 [Cyanobacteria bacterium P01_H01_bin.105]
MLDWHAQRGLSFLQLGLRELERLGYLGLPLPTLNALSRYQPRPAYASRKKQAYLDTRIEFSRVTVFSA